MDHDLGGYPDLHHPKPEKLAPKTLSNRNYKGLGKAQGSYVLDPE